MIRLNPIPSVIITNKNIDIVHRRIRMNNLIFNEKYNGQEQNSTRLSVHRAIKSHLTTIAPLLQSTTSLYNKKMQGTKI